MSEAREFIERAKEKGCTPTSNGEWTKWEPPLPADMLMEAVRLADDIAREIKKHEP